MKEVNKTGSALLRGLFMLLVAVPMLNSCFDDSELWEAIDQLEMRVDSLENGLNAQIEAMSALMTENLMIKDCVMNTDSSYVVTLSNGMTFTVLPGKTSVQTLVSCVVVNGVKCWATYDAVGVLTPLLDAKGAPIPVNTDVNVQIKDGKYYLVINGKEYMTGFDSEEVVQVFTSCEAHKDASGQVYAMTFEFGNGLEVTVTVDGYKGVLFKLSNINTTVLTEYFIDYGTTQSFLLDAKGVVDYVMQIPDGWRVKERVEQVTGDVYVDITAPSKEIVKMGAAVASGDLKVVSVVEGGKAAVTRLYLSSDPYKLYNVSYSRAVVEMYAGVQKYMYGLLPSASFDRSQIVAKVNELLSSSASLPEGYFMEESPLNKRYAEMYPDLNVEESYVFWIVPAIYSESEEYAGFTASEDMFRSHVILPVSATIECDDVTVLDARICVDVDGTDSIFAGTLCMKDDQGNLKTVDKVLEEVIYGITNGIYEPVSDADLLSYNGLASAFPDTESPLSFDPATEYMSWIVPVEADKSEYYVTDVVYTQFKTLEVKDGGSLQVTVGEAVTDYSSITASVSCDDAAMIYYAYLDDNVGSRYAEEAMGNVTKWNQLNKAASRTVIRGTSEDAVIDRILPKTTMWLYAVAVGHDGLYGPVKCVKATTKAYEFNGITVTVNPVEVGSENARFQVSVSGGTATDYIYWVGRTTNDFFKTVCGGNRNSAEQFMAANPDSPEIVDVMKANGKIAADGTLNVSGLNINKQHVILVLAKDSEGKYSRAGYKLFTTASIDLGANFAAEDSDKWKQTKKWIEDNIVWDQDYFEAGAGSGQGSASYAFDIKIPTDLTASIYCYGVPENMTDMIDQIVYVEAQSSKSAAYGKVVYDENGKQPLLPDWYDDCGRLVQGTLLSISTFFVHGDPSRGYVTYFAKDGHDDHCPVWTDGACASYVQYQEDIKKYCSLDYWKSYLITFGNYNHEGDPNNEHSRKLTDPDKINEIAQQYCELYTEYYEGAEPVFYVNDGKALRMINRTATGLDSEGKVVDKITIVLKDLDNNYYAPMVIDVPNYFN